MKISYSDFNELMLNKFDKKRGDSTFIEYLNQLFDFYLDNIKLVDGFSNKNIYDAQELIKSILDIYNVYSKGNICSAVYKALAILQNSNLRTFGTCHFLLHNWYRARILEEGKSSFSRGEMFHTPFELRHKVDNYRFSINGYPCLYLGKTILACWEEMKRPALDRLCVSYFKMNKMPNLLDITLPSIPKQNPLWEDEGEEANRIKLVKTWPITMACSIKAMHSDSPFKEEYIFPQVLMLALLRTNKYDGIAFTSTQRDSFFNEDMTLHTNVAIPVKACNNEGHCGQLKSIFSLTNGISFLEAQIRNAVGKLPPVSGDDYEANTNDYYSSDYAFSRFAQMEDYLQKHVEIGKI